MPGKTSNQLFFTMENVLVAPATFNPIPIQFFLSIKSAPGGFNPLDVSAPVKS